MGKKLGPLLEITTAVGCRNACVYCPQDKLTRAYAGRSGGTIRSMSLETFKTCVDKVPTDISIVFSGMVDPWFNEQCPEMILYAHENGFKVSVFTTAVGMSPQEIQKIQHIPFGHFIVHLPDDDAKNTRIPCDKAHLDTIKRIQSSQIHNLQFIVVGRVHPQVKAVMKKNVAERTLVDRAGNLQKEKLKTFKTTIVKTRDVDDVKIRCARTSGDVLNQNVLFPNGDVVLCCMDYGMNHVIGNLLHDSYDDMFQSEAYLRLKEGMQRLSDPPVLCRSCSEGIRDNALSPLIASMRLTATGSLHRVSPRLHKYIKRSFVYFSKR